MRLSDSELEAHKDDVELQSCAGTYKRCGNNMFVAVHHVCIGLSNSAPPAEASNLPWASCVARLGPARPATAVLPTAKSNSGFVHEAIYGVRRRVFCSAAYNCLLNDF